MTGLVAVAGILAVTAPAEAMDGNGTPSNPFTAGCDANSKDACTVTFPERMLKGMDSEKLESYQCPWNHPTLENRKYAPARKDISNGIEIRGMGGFLIDATATSTFANNGLSHGTVTNWNTAPRPYGVTLHCH